MPSTDALAPVVANVATSAVTSVPAGTVAVMLDPEIVATTVDGRPGLSADRNTKRVIAFAELGAIATVTVKLCV